MQPEICLGLGLFESMHIIDGAKSRKSGDVSSILEELY